MAKRITSDYDSHTREELLDEIGARKAAGRNIEGNTGSPKGDLVASLDQDDKSGDAAQGAISAAVAPLKGNIPQYKMPENIPVVSGQPKDEDFKDGIFRSKIDGEQYALCKVPDAADGKTHKLKNSLHYWEGNEREFKETFDKE